MSVQDFPPRPQDAEFDSAAFTNWLDALRNRQNIDAMNTVTTVSSADETYVFSVSQNKTFKATVQQFLAGFSLTAVTGTLSADVPLTSTTQYFTGPQVSAAGGGTWVVIGACGFYDNVSAQAFNWKLTDGTTTMASQQVQTPPVNGQASVTLVGVITNPAGNLRMAANNPGSTSGIIAANSSGNGKDCIVVAVKIG